MDAAPTNCSDHSTTYSKQFQAVIATLMSLWKFLLASTALREGAKLFLVGSVLEMARRMVAMAWKMLVEIFFITAEFEDRDETFTWIMFWLSRQPKWSAYEKATPSISPNHFVLEGSSHRVRVSTFRYGQSGVSNLVQGEEGEAKIDLSRRVAYVPSHNKAVTIWYHKTWISATLVQTQGDMWNRRGDERLKITMFARSISKLDELLLDAKRSYKRHSEGRINIYVSDGSNDWTLTGSRPRRPLASVVLDRNVKERLLADAKDFVASEKWYTDRGIPWRRGYLLHGSPGSGKTSLIHSLAGELGLDIYVIALSKKTLDDSTLNELISKIPPKTIALMEDIDVAFYRGVTRENEAKGVPLMPGQPPGELAPLSASTLLSSQAPTQSASGVTLSGLLAAIDGVAAQEGRLLFATTNKYSALDPALIRPGRLDVHIRFENAGKRQAAELFRRFFPPVSEGEDETEDEEDLDDQYLDELESLTAVESPPSSPTYASFSSEAESEERTADSHRTMMTGAVECNIGPSLSRDDVKYLSLEFARRIPEGEFSMASLQGLLMQYKARPRDVLEDLGAWIAEERHNRNEYNKGGSN